MNNINPINNDLDTEIDLKKVYSSLLKGRKWVATSMLIFVLISIIYVFFIAKPVYTSETILLLINAGSDQSKLSGFADVFGIPMPIQNNNVDYMSTETLPKILSSRTLAKSILYTSFDSKEFDKPTSLLNIITDQKDIADADSNKIIAKAIDHISKNILDIKQIGKTSMFLLQVNSLEPKLSADISSVVINELEKLRADFTKLELSDKKEFISERLVDVQNELFQAETELKNFREQNFQISLSPSLLLQQERLEREIEVQTQVYISLKQQFEQVKIDETQNKSFLKIIDPPNIPIYHSKPKRKLIVILSGLMGIMIGGIIAVVKNY